MDYCLWLVGDTSLDEQQFADLIAQLSTEEIIWSANNPTQFQPYRLACKVNSALEPAVIKEHLRAVLMTWPLDGFVKPWDRRELDIKLIIMDMDSTLVQAETIDQIANHAGVMAQVSSITEAAMRGELDFTESLTKRVAMLKGISKAQLEEVHNRLPLTDGAEQLVTAARQNNCMTVLVSGGFTYFAQPIVERLGINEVHANELGFNGEQLSGEVVGTVVDAQYKKDTLLKLIAQNDLQSEQTIAIGDGANDLLMLAEAGTGVAFHGKPKVQEQANSVINNYGLQAINWLLHW